MGIQGLLGAIGGLIKDAHIQDFNGKKAAIDGYCWLHKAVYGCCEELCNGTDTKAWVPYCLAMIDMLLYNNITVVLVFDGGKLPSKDGVEYQRSSNRQKNLELANEFKSKGDYKNARVHYARAVDVTPLMAAELIKILKATRPSVTCIVAPFEADAQLAYLSATEFVDIVISEDSDCIPYGCREIVFKLNSNGACKRLLLSDLFLKVNDGFDLRCFTMEMVVALCVASGCDYVKSVPGFGIKHSYKLISQCKTSSSMLRIMRLKGLIPLEAYEPTANDPCSSRVCAHRRVLQYEFDFCKAVATFRHQIVFDPLRRTLRPLTSISADEMQCFPLTCCFPSTGGCTKTSSTMFLGIMFDNQIACQIADGLIDPMTHLPFIISEPIFDIPRYLPSVNIAHDKAMIEKSKNSKSFLGQNIVRSSIVKYFKLDASRHRSSLENNEHPKNDALCHSSCLTDIKSARIEPSVTDGTSSLDDWLSIYSQQSQKRLALSQALDEFEIDVLTSNVLHKDQAKITHDFDIQNDLPYPSKSEILNDGGMHSTGSGSSSSSSLSEASCKMSSVLGKRSHHFVGHTKKQFTNFSDIKTSLAKLTSMKTKCALLAIDSINDASVDVEYEDLYGKHQQSCGFILQKMGEKTDFTGKTTVRGHAFKNESEESSESIGLSAPSNKEQVLAENNDVYDSVLCTTSVDEACDALKQFESFAYKSSPALSVSVLHAMDRFCNNNGSGGRGGGNAGTGNTRSSHAAATTAATAAAALRPDRDNCPVLCTRAVIAVAAVAAAAAETSGSPASRASFAEFLYDS